MIFIEKIKKLLVAERIQFRAFMVLSSIAAFLMVLNYIIDPGVFIRFFGNANPILVLLVSIGIGFLLLTYLISKTDLRIYQRNRTRNYLIIAGIALLFGIEVILADIWLVDYPKDINVLFPESLIFYPAIGYIAEIVFHLLPLSIFISLFAFFRKLRINTVVWIGIILVSIMEPVYQILFISHAGLLTIIYTGIHVFLFSLTQLIIFKRFDFISMYFFRIVFYLVWHISWGYFRLNLLF